MTKGAKNFDKGVEQSNRAFKNIIKKTKKMSNKLNKNIKKSLDNTAKKIKNMSHDATDAIFDTMVSTEDKVLDAKEELDKAAIKVATHSANWAGDPQRVVDAINTGVAAVDLGL